MRNISSIMTKKQMLKRCVFIVVSLIYMATTGVDAQITTKENDYLLNRNPESLSISAPNAASFNRYEHNPIDLYSGTSRIDVPLYTLKDGAIEIPIRLSYGTSGIKVNEEASWVGLGWTLNVGGYVNRIVIGQADRHEEGTYYKDVMDAYDKDRILTNTDYIKGPWSFKMRESMDWFLTEPSMRKTPYEGRYNPDVYYFSCPDGSGRFIIDNRDNSAYILDRTENVKIELEIYGTGPGMFVNNTFGGHLGAFKMTFSNGVMHKFTLMSSMQAVIPVYMGTQAETYVLSQTVYPNGQKVDYTYGTIDFVGYNYGERTQSLVPSSSVRVDNNISFGDNHVEYSHTSQNLTICSGNEIFLTTIATTNYQVNFIASGREDLPSVKKLDRIYIKPRVEETSPDTCFHDFRFAYSYFISDNSSKYWSKGFSNFNAYRSNDNMLKRLKLLSVSSVMGAEKAEKYTFSYNSKSLPRKDSYAVDYWGCYNGQLDNASFIPDLYYLMWHNLPEYNQIKNLPSDNWTTLSKALRAYDFESCKAGILTGIQYPTGGYTELTYEPNQFVDYFVPTLSQTKTDTPMLIKNIFDDNSFEDHGSDTYPSAKNFFYSFSESKEVEVIVNIYRGNNTWAEVANHRAYIEYPVQGKLVRKELSLKQECDDLHIKEEVNHQSLSYNVSKAYSFTMPKGSGYFIVDFPDALGNQIIGSGSNGRITMTVKYNKDGLNEKKASEGAGVRIKEVKFYDSPSKGVLLKRTSYEYTDPITGLCSGLLLNKLKFISYYVDIYDKLGKHTSTNCDFQAVESIVCRSTKLELSGSNYYSSPYQPSPDVAYTYVREIRQGGDNPGYTLYNYYNKEGKMEEHSIPIFDPLNGKLLQTSVYDSSNKLVEQVRQTYSSSVYHYYFGMNFYDRINLFPEMFNRSGWQCMEMSDNNEGVSLRQCINKVYHVLMEFNQDFFEGTYLPNNARLAMIVHPLNAHNILLQKKTTMKDGVETEETYTYAPSTLQLKSRQMTLSNGKSVKTTYTYPNDCNWGAYSTMALRNYIAPVIEEKIFRNDYLTGGILTEYAAISNGLIVPSVRHHSVINQVSPASTVTFSASGRNKSIYPNDDVIYKAYDSFGNVLNLLTGNLLERTYLWGYGGQYPIAEIQKATYAEVKSALGSTTPEQLALSPIPNMTLVRSLRTKLPSAIIRTYDYRRQAGMSEMIESNNCITSYGYDAFGRLKNIKDCNNSTKEQYDYHYKP